MLNRQITTFICCANCGSFTAAAERLFISPPAVMKQINELEARLCMPLFQRTSKGLTLTKAGETFLEDCRYMAKYSEDAVERARAAESEENQTVIRIGASMLYTADWLFSLMKKHEQEFKPFGIQLTRYLDDSEKLLQILNCVGKDMDFATVFGDSAEWPKHCGLLIFGQEKIKILMSRKHRLAERESLTPDDLRGENILVFKKGVSPILDSVREELGRIQGLKIHSTSYYEVGTFNKCEEKNCLMLTLDSWANIHPSLITKDIDWDYTMPYGLIYPLNIRGAAARFLETLKSVYGL